MNSRWVRRLGVCLALLAVPCWARGQKHSAIPLVPAASWRLVSSRTSNLDTVRHWGGDPTIEREYGVRTLEHRAYALNGQTTSVIVEEAPDPSAAYGLLTYYQTEGMQPASGMQLTLIGAEVALMARGRYFIRVPRPPSLQVSDIEFRALLVFTGGTRSLARTPPHLPAALPVEGLIPGSEKYLLGPEAARRVLSSFRTDLIGFPQGAELQMAMYRSGDLRLTLLAISYPTPQIARARFGAMETFLELNQERGSESVFARRSGSYVFLVLGSSSRLQAAKLMDQLQVTGTLSWDRPYPRPKPFAQEVLELIIANLLLILILVGFSVIGGVLFFIWRRIVAKWFPQWAWANPDRDALIRLNLS